MLDWLLKLATIWFSINVIIIATGWYISTIVEPRWPDWWKRHIVGDDPEWSSFERR